MPRARKEGQIDARRVLKMVGAALNGGVPPPARSDAIIVQFVKRGVNLKRTCRRSIIGSASFLTLPSRVAKPNLLRPIERYGMF
ncbi:MAG: hypothetical protein B7Y36_07605 [Novosphingobium sp. 28-62-57]|nr:MAG: hypothetical protein B7Z36_00700 [Novosphingobium sp. 12-63-9]OYZ10691.1 MAG: hypothetical protein B7Y36_07605 [Novosphingobium sp. 28-62-57]OZA33074.1 MAG: hypothetical protein B7X92_11725 [Novosphingobium sp. 17-62-9]